MRLTQAQSRAGFATPDGTRTYARRHPDLSFTTLGRTGLLVSEAGFGGYRIDRRDPDHRAALQNALSAGINLIDTSANYSNGESEQLIGSLLGDGFDAGRLDRQSLVVVTKGGYIQGVNHHISQERQAQGRPFPDLVAVGHGLEHCIHPEFLEDQITRSLERLNLAAVDVYLLHNPEYYLTWAAQKSIAPEAARTEYGRRITLAFQHLENEVRKGRIRCYGISSNTFPLPMNDPEFTSLEDIWRMAESVSGDHHFHVIQLPLNLFEPGAVIEKNQSQGRSVLEFAAETGLGVLANRPLNSILKNRLIRLAEAEINELYSRETILERITEVIQSESFLFSDLLPQLALSPALKNSIAANFSIGRTLLENWENFESLARWQALERQYFLPRIQEVLQFLATLEDPPPEFTPWMRRHVDLVRGAFSAVENRYKANRARRSAEIRRIVDGLDTEWASAGPLNRVALRAVRSTPGVTSVLVGMRRPEYVEDVLTELSHPVSRHDRNDVWKALFPYRERLP